MSPFHPETVAWLGDLAAQKCAVRDMEAPPEVAEGAIIWDKTRKELWPGCRGWRLFPWSCLTVVREANKAGEMRPCSVIFNALHLREI